MKKVIYKLILPKKTLFESKLEDICLTRILGLHKVVKRIVLISVSTVKTF